MAADPDAPDATPVLVVEDDDAITELVVTNLAAVGLAPHRVRTGRAALTELERTDYALIVLDVGLPGLDGFEVLRSVRRTRTTPVLMLTARAELEDRILGFELGADDYLAKPFSPVELVARVRAILRRAGPHEARAVLDVGSLQLDPTTRSAIDRGEPVALTPLEFDLLYALARAPGSTLSRDAASRQLWGAERAVDARAVDNLVRRLRRKLEADPAAPTRLCTVWGTGYKLEPRA
jgi:DNA-binding response OmpR family regulator